MDAPEKEFNAALFKLQHSLQAVKKEKENTFHKSHYADLPSVWDELGPKLKENNFILTGETIVNFSPTPFLIWRYVLTHAPSGHTKAWDYPLPSDTTNPQKTAAATTYARRVSAGGFFAIMTTEDDDGNTAADLTEIPTVARIPANTIRRAPEDSGFEVARFVPTSVNMVPGKGKGEGKTFSEIFRSDGAKFSGNELQGEIAASAMNGHKEIIVAFEKKGQYLNAKKVKLAVEEEEAVPF